jgi:hypothetical protein
MKQNMGTLDRIFRLIVAVIIAGLYLTGQLSGIAATILGIVAVVFLVTSILGLCPAYLPLGLSTRKGGGK